MSHPPQSFMIYKEELRKAKLERERLKKDYEDRIKHLTDDLSNLKERLSSQEEMMKTALNYAMELEERLDGFKNQLDKDNERNGSGYH